MIEYINGRVTALNPAYAVVESGAGIGYRLNISLPTFSALEGKERAILLVHESIREDAWVLYGFAEEREREVFRLLIGVSGVGAATAMLMLSALPGEELSNAIANGDVRLLKSIKGIGAKTAERIVVDLRDKVCSMPINITIAPGASRAPEALDEALAALIMLGFDRRMSAKALEGIFRESPDIKVEQAIKKALTLMR